MEYPPILTILLCALFNYSAGASITLKEKSGVGWAIDDHGCRMPGGGVGECISINKCKVFQNFIPNRDDYICGSEVNQIKVCCPIGLPFALPTEPALDHSQHPNIGLLPTKDICGTSNYIVPIAARNIPELFEFPWAALLKFDTDNNPYACGASVISKRYVLTAARCIRSDIKLVGVRLGEYNFTSPIDCRYPNLCAKEPQDFQISTDDAIVHPQYDEKKLLNDIALIRLPREAVIDRSVFPICLPIQKSEKERTHEYYRIIGWGKTEAGLSSKLLLKGIVPTVDNSICASQYQRQIQVTDNQLCAGGNNTQDACIGDSGSLLSSNYLSNDGHSRTIQYGLVSFGPGRDCGRESLPVVYTKIAKYVQWILDNIKP